MPRKKYTIEDILKDKSLYLNVPCLKLKEAKFFFKKMDNLFSSLQPIPDPKQLQPMALKISFYASAFYSSVVGFFDSLAIYHTRNRIDCYRDIHFRRWLDWQICHSQDTYIDFLRQEREQWIDKFIDNRNVFIHSLHVYARMNTLLYIHVETGQPDQIKIISVNLQEGPTEIVPYCKKILDKLDKMVAKINNNLNLEYEYKP